MKVLSCPLPQRFFMIPAPRYDAYSSQDARRRLFYFYQRLFSAISTTLKHGAISARDKTLIADKQEVSSSLTRASHIFSYSHNAAPTATMTPSPIHALLISPRLPPSMAEASRCFGALIYARPAAAGAYIFGAGRRLHFRAISRRLLLFPHGLHGFS